VGDLWWRIIKLDLFFNDKYCFASVRFVETVNVQLTSTASTNDDLLMLQSGCDLWWLRLRLKYSA
jgi:hypothetical protein